MGGCSGSYSCGLHLFIPDTFQLLKYHIKCVFPTQRLVSQLLRNEASDIMMIFPCDVTLR